jgi:hypothetical protein
MGELKNPVVLKPLIRQPTGLPWRHIVKGGGTPTGLEEGTCKLSEFTVSSPFLRWQIIDTGRSVCGRCKRFNYGGRTGSQAGDSFALHRATLH